MAKSGVRAAVVIPMLVVLFITCCPAWAKTFEIVGRWNSTYGKMILKYVGTNPDGTMAIRGRWLYDREKRQIGKIQNGTYNRKAGTITFNYLEDWGTVTGKARFKLSPDGTKFVGSYTDSSGGKGEWILDRPLSESMMNYLPDKTRIVNIDNDDYLFNDNKVIVFVVGKGGSGNGAPAGNGTPGGGEMKSRDEGSTPISLTVINNGTADIRVNWVDQAGKESKSADIIKGKSKKLLGTTYAGHVYRAREAKYDSLLKEYRVAKGNPNQSITIDGFVP